MENEALMEKNGHFSWRTKLFWKKTVISYRKRGSFGKKTVISYGKRSSFGKKWLFLLENEALLEKNGYFSWKTKLFWKKTVISYRNRCFSEKTARFAISHTPKRPSSLLTGQNNGKKRLRLPESASRTIPIDCKQCYWAIKNRPLKMMRFAV
jgi:hypothetical protein